MAMAATIDNIKAFARSGFRTHNGETPTSHLAASAFGWGEGNARIEGDWQLGDDLRVTRGFVGPQRAVVFGTAPKADAPEAIQAAALFAYHASIEWGVIVGGEGAVVLNSHWVRNNEWFHLPMVRWSDLSRDPRLLTAIDPEGLTSGRLERIATDVLEPERFLRPVDDALVDRLDHWRDKSIEHARQVVSVDEQLQVLFAQLFVLRAVEDRGLHPGLPRLLDVVRDGLADLSQLRDTFAIALANIQSELFAASSLDNLPAFVLGGIINDLYYVHGLPRGAHRYNFAWIDADILGRAYEKYLSHVLTPAPLQAQLQIFEQPLRGVGRVSVRRTTGVYYTPPYLSGYLTDQCLGLVGGTHLKVSDDDLDLSEILDEATKRAGSEDRLPYVADFACGSGSFLVAAADWLIRRLREKDPHRNWARELVDGKHIVGIDIDDKAVTITRMNLWIRFTEEPHALPLPRLEEIIVAGDSLTDSPWKTLPHDYDVVLGNPPFLATGKTAPREELAVRFRSAQGRFDYSYLFVELAVNRLRAGGVLGMVVPNRLFRNRDAGTIRDILATETDILSIVDFGVNEVFVGTTAYIGSLIARKRAPAGERATHVRVIVVSDVSAKYIGSLLSRGSETPGHIHNDVMEAFDASHPHGSDAWLLLSPHDRRMRYRLDREVCQLGDVAGIFQGIRTGSNDLFLVEIGTSDGELATVVNGLGDDAVIEVALLRPAVVGPDIQRYDLVQGTRHLLYPYRGGASISEAELRKTFPRTYEYLSRYREPLSARGSISAGGLRWFDLVRKREEGWLTSRKLLTRDLTTKTSFALDNVGSTFLVGGTAVVPFDPGFALALLSYLNSSVISEFLGQITPSFRQGFQKIEPQHLQRVPILGTLLDDAGLKKELTQLGAARVAAQVESRPSEAREAEQRIDQLLAQALSLPTE